MNAMAQDYRWKITYSYRTNVFTVIGYLHINGQWSQDGAQLRYNSFDEVLKLLSESEAYTSKTKEMK